MLFSFKGVQGNKTHLGQEEYSAVVRCYFHLKASKLSLRSLQCFSGSDVCVFPLRSRDQCHSFLFRLRRLFCVCVRRQYLLQMPPFDLDVLAITMACSASLVLFFRYHWEVSQMCDCFISSFYMSLFVFCRKKQRYKTRYFSHSAFCVISCFSFLDTSSVRNEWFAPILFHSFPLHQVTYIFFSVRPSIFFSNFSTKLKL
jgi:hypothetical protein